MKPQSRWLVVFLDYTEVPRAWGVASDKVIAERVARENLATYCARQVDIEPALANPADYTMRVEVIA